MGKKQLCWFKTLLLFVSVVLLSSLFAWFARYGGYQSVGFFPQVVILDSAKPIEKVYYTGGLELNDEVRQQVERTADPVLFSREASLDEDRFTVQLMFTTGPGIFDGPTYPPHLALLVEFADGTRVCRVVDLPKEKGREVLVVRLP